MPEFGASIVREAWEGDGLDRSGRGRQGIGQEREGNSAGTKKGGN